MKIRGGISLIVLVITIIIMIILAASVILSLSGSNIIEKATEAKDKTNKSNLLESANVEYLKWTLTDKSEPAITYVRNELSDKFTADELSLLKIENEGVALKEVLVANDVVPAGCIYKRGENEYGPGTEMPAVEINDKFITADYTYIYYDNNGWSVTVNNRNKSSYEDIYTTIANKNVTNMRMTFAYCFNLITAPDIPSCVTMMFATFNWCEKLATTPEIPANVTNMNSTFAGCHELTGEMVINANPSTYSSCFGDTRLSIILTGSSSTLAELAATASGNVTVANT